ncbi:helix-turn-helix domain-containing protein [Rhodococcus coprophilus]|uniref:Transcriptional regulator n=1 Tax=Rhodococcus coprophilus TaxID=38310 RepID=A0A2X4UVZ4_9NOCA|nr:helix-turn-helix domain-containing protein [Rhodococcus coprophilus]MBM7459725.1 AraC-like DNA-binding protein [Rhodococcus coprophilus]SQI37200.1 transcriptional regulator [Rhodococcus coprophilus]
MSEPRRDRLRELLDAVLDENNVNLEQMAQGAYASPWYFTRQFGAGTGESPVALRRRVMLERAAWQLRRGAAVTDTAFAAGYNSVEGFGRAFARAYGYPPGATARAEEWGSRSHWLPAPNGVHFHPPMNLWVEDGTAPSPAGQSASEVVARLVHHDLDDTRALLHLARDLEEAEYERIRFPGLVVLEWDGPEESIGQVLENLVWTKEVWLSSMSGGDQPTRDGHGREALPTRFDEVAPRWADAVRDIDRRGAWGDRLIDALCDPPESFVLGGVISHVLTFSAHRRQLVRHMLRAAGRTVDHGDPLEWPLEHERTTR